MRLVPLGEVLDFAGVPERITHPAGETFVTVKLNGGGAVKRVIKDGKVPVAFTGYRIRQGQFLYSRIDARNGAFALVPRELDGAVVSKDFPVFDVKSERIDVRYLIHFVAAGRLQREIQTLSLGATNRQRITEQRFLAFELPLPPVDKQRRIAAILDHAHDLRVTSRLAAQRANSFEQATFWKMFGTGQHEKCIAVIDVCDRITVGVVVKPASHYVTEGVPALRTLNVKPGAIDESDLVYFSKAANEGPLAKSQLRTGDVVISRTGRAGVAAIVPPHLDKANAIDLIIVTPKATRVDSLYFESLLNSTIGKQLVLGEQRGQIQQHFNIGSLKSALLPFPPLSSQREFANKVRQARLVGARLAAQTRELDSLFTSLQSRAFSGQL